MRIFLELPYLRCDASPEWAIPAGCRGRRREHTNHMSLEGIDQVNGLGLCFRTEGDPLLVIDR